MNLLVKIVLASVSLCALLYIMASVSMFLSHFLPGIVQIKAFKSIRMRIYTGGLVEGCGFGMFTDCSSVM